MKRSPRDKNVKSGIFWALIVVVGVIVLAVIGISIGKEAYRKKQIQNEIDGLQTDIQKMNQQNTDLDNLISYLSTTEFQEKQAREKLDLQKGDEKMIVLQKSIEAQDSNRENFGAPAKNTPGANSPNWQKWLRLFFAQN